MKHKNLWAVLGAALVLTITAAAVQAQSSGGPTSAPSDLRVDDQSPLVKFRVLEGSAVRWKLDIMEEYSCLRLDCLGWTHWNEIPWRSTRNVEFRRDRIVNSGFSGETASSYVYVLTVEVDGEPRQFKYMPSKEVSMPSELPIARDDTATTVSGKAVVVDVLANDVWLDGEDPNPTPAYRLENENIYWGNPPMHGTASATDGRITYVADRGFLGTDEFSYSLDGGTFGGGWMSAVWANVTVTVTAAPPPTKSVSFVGGSATVAKDTPFVERLQAAGYTVTRHDDDTVTPAQVDGTVVVISSSVDPVPARALATQLDESVVTWEPYIAHELGMVTAPSANKVLTAREVPTPWPAGSSPFFDPATIRVVDPFHPVVQDAMQIVHDADGFEVPVLRPLSSVTAATPWSVIDERYLPAGQDPAIGRKGAPAAPGHPYGYGHVVVNSASSRVLLPWTYQTQHLLTPDGWTLFLNAVEWADGAS